MHRNFFELKSGGDNSYAVPPALKSGGTRPPPRPPPIDAREFRYGVIESVLEHIKSRPKIHHINLFLIFSYLGVYYCTTI